MPLRDHFRPPVVEKSSWEGFHAVWPTVIVQHLRSFLPPGYKAEPRVRLGTEMEIDIEALESRDDPSYVVASQHNGGTGTATWTGGPAVLALETELPEEYEYEVRIFDHQRRRELVAAIELVSPAQGPTADTRSLRCEVRRFTPQRRRRQCRRSRDHQPAQPLRPTDGVHRAPRSHDVAGRPSDLRRVVPLDQPRPTGQVGGVVVPDDRGRGPADVAAVAGPRTRGAALDLDASYEKACYDLRIA